MTESMSTTTTRSAPTRGEASDPLELARGLRPQAFGTGSSKDVRDPLVEPLWAGIRVIGASQGGRVELLEGDRRIEDQSEIAMGLANIVASTADGVIVEGYLTKQVSSGGAGVFLAGEEPPSTGEFLTRTIIGERRKRSEAMLKEREEALEARTFRPEDRIALIVVDLLWLDGTWLLDVPLLERRRLLEAVIPETELVRPGPYVRPPIDPWVGSWRAQGFTGLTFKAANGRYHPGAAATDWAIAQMPRR